MMFEVAASVFPAVSDAGAWRGSGAGSALSGFGGIRDGVGRLIGSVQFGWSR